MKPYSPNLSKQVFSNIILEIQDYEGNNIKIVNAIRDGLNDSKEYLVYDAFLDICENFDITFRCYTENREKTIYGIKLYKEGYDWFTFEYSNKDRDISEILARKLYELVAIQIQNEAFVKSHKKSL